MKLLFLCKRRPQGRDLFTDPFGRFFHIPRLLAERGHDVHLLLLGYRREAAEMRQVDGLSFHAIPVLPWGPWGYLATADALCTEIGPDWVIGFSDTWYGIIATQLAARHGCRSLVDAYDNYESYIPWAKPLHWAWRRACRRAAAVTAAGPELLELMKPSGSPGLRAVVPMAADPGFQPMDRDNCRAALGLPLDATLVGYAGSLYRSRGIETLFEVFREMSSRLHNVRLVVSGRRQRGVEIPADLRAHVIDLGFVPDEKVAVLLNSLDVALVVNRDSAFGRYSYPVKLYEAMACGVPVVATNVPGSAWILRDHPELLARPDDAGDFAAKAIAAVGSKRLGYAELSTWNKSAALLEGLLDEVIRAPFG